MNLSSATSTLSDLASRTTQRLFLLRSFFAGLLIPFGFAPFHFPGMAILGLSLLFAQLYGQTLKQSFFTGFRFGLGFMGLGVSWIYNSIHTYGHLNIPLSALITGLFIVYLALFHGLFTLLFTKFSTQHARLFNCFLFTAFWCLGEIARSSLFTGFPWLLIGFGQIDTPLKYLLPIVGVFGVSFMACLSATFLATAIQASRLKIAWITTFLAILLSPLVLKNIEWTTIQDKPISVGVIQANLSMRDKWDETLFWQLLDKYQTEVDKLMGKKQLIVLPESAIPVPATYVNDLLDDMNQRATAAGSTILLGIPQPNTSNDTEFYNTITSLGLGKGSYLKQHLVPFGEFIPSPFRKLMDWFSLPPANMLPGKNEASSISVQKHPIATLICYELAFPNLLRQQLPLAEWIVSISDDGWFGHSLAVYQHLQMAQALSIETGRFQIVANNDGLSSIITPQGDISTSLPAFSSGILEGTIKPATGSSPWVYFGDNPVYLLSFGVFLIAFLRAMLTRRHYEFKYRSFKSLY